MQHSTCLLPGMSVSPMLSDVLLPSRGSGAVGDRNGHHGLWIQKSSNVIMTK